MLQACDEPEPDGISDIRHHYGNRVGCLLQELDGWGGRLAASQCPTSRDFVPWRFLDAGRHSAWKGSSCRRPKTRTKPEVECQTWVEEVGQSCVTRHSRIRRSIASLPPPLRFRTTTISPLAGEIPVRARMFAPWVTTRR